MPSWPLGAFAFAVCLAVQADAWAAGGAPAAMIEAIDGAGGDHAAFDYVEPETRIELSSGGTVVLGYFSSCVSETITGGVVVVGTSQSAVTGGTVSRTYVDCDGGGVVTAPSQSQEVAAIAFRETADPDDLPKADRVIFDVHPLVRTDPSAAAVVLSRLDAAEADQRLPLIDGIGDGRAAGIALAPGGTYLFTAGGRSLIVKVSRLAGDSAERALVRLVPM